MLNQSVKKTIPKNVRYHKDNGQTCDGQLKQLPVLRVQLLSKTTVQSEGQTFKQKRSTEGCSKFKGPETRLVQERLVSTLEHMQVPKWDRTRCPGK